MVAIAGNVDPGFDSVRDAFAANFAAGLELGASLCVYLRGRPVVDLWGGIADERTGRSWTADTVAVTFSTTKGMTAVCANMCIDRGLLDGHGRVAPGIWPCSRRS